MPRNEEGEFELVLGNRQLLSGFFIVVILFGVFFTMGYIVGRHSSPPPPVSAASPPAAAAPAAPHAATAGALPPGQAEVVTADEKRGEIAPPEKTDTPGETRPATAPPEPARGGQAARAEQKRQQSDLGPEPGTYLQVAAPKRAAADGVVEALKKKGILALMIPGPDETTVRVVVGPFKDAEGLGKMRSELEASGFKPFIKKVN